MQQILVSGELISITADVNDIMRGVQRFYGFKSGVYYDPKNDFKPLTYGKHRPDQKTRDEFNDLMDAAEKAFYEAQEALKSGEQPSGNGATSNEEHEAEVRTLRAELERREREINELAAKKATEPAQTGAMSRIESMLTETLATLAVSDVVEMAKPKIDEFIKKEFGVLPQVHEIKTGSYTHKITGVIHEKFETILQLVLHDIPVFMTGPAGTGKNYLCKQVADAIGTEFYFSNAVTQEYKLTGFIDANGRYHETQFYKAFVNGGLFMLDEIDASTPDVLVILNAAIANRYFDFPTGRAEASPEFRLIAAGNTFGTGADIEYTGRYQLDAASLDRFALIEIDYSPAIEEAIANGDSDLLLFAREFRKATNMAGLKIVVSYRSIERIRKLADAIDNISELLRMCLTKGMAQDDLSIVVRNMNIRGNKYYSALKAEVA